MEACLDPMTMDPYICPAGEPPLGVMPMNPLAKGYSTHGMCVTTAITIAFVIPAVAIRIFTKGYILKRLQVEDYCLLVALAGCIAISGVMGYAYNTYRIGRHQWDTSVADFVQTLKYINVVQITYPPFMILAKTALLLQIQRIFVPPKQRNSIFWASWTLIALNFIVYTTIFFAFIFACVPRAKISNPSLPGKCLDTGALMLVTSVINLLSDVSILLLPMRAVWSLKMSTKKKLGVAAIFGTGLLAIGASVVRLIYTIHLAATLKAPPGVIDLTYKVAPTGMWTAAEFAAVLLCCTFPTFPRFVSWARSKDKDVRSSLQYSAGSSFPPRRLRSTWGDMVTMDTKVGTGTALWEIQNGSGSIDGEKCSSQVSLGTRNVPLCVEEGGIWRSVEIETRSMRKSVSDGYH